MLNRFMKKSSGGNNSGSIYGSVLTEICQPSPTQNNEFLLPSPIVKLIQYLSVAPAVNSSGLFRSAGHESEVKKIKKALDEGSDDVNFQKYGAPSVAASLSAFFKELKQPLLPSFLLDFIRSPGGAAKLEISSVRNWIDKFPPVHRSVFLQMLQFWSKLLDHKDNNKLNAQALATLWAPYMYFAMGGRDEPFANAAVSTFLCFAIENAKSIVTVDVLSASGHYESQEDSEDEDDDHDTSTGDVVSFNDSPPLKTGGNKRLQQQQQQQQQQQDPVDLSVLLKPLEELREFFVSGKNAIEMLTTSNSKLQDHVRLLESKLDSLQQQQQQKAPTVSPSSTASSSMMELPPHLQAWRESTDSSLEELKYRVDAESKERNALFKMNADLEERLSELSKAKTYAVSSPSAPKDAIEDIRLHLEEETSQRRALSEQMQSANQKLKAVDTWEKQFRELDSSAAALNREMQALRLKVDSSSKAGSGSGGGGGINPDNLAEAVQNSLSAEKASRFDDYNKWKAQLEEQFALMIAEHFDMYKKQLEDIKSDSKTNASASSSSSTPLSNPKLEQDIAATREEMKNIKKDIQVIQVRVDACDDALQQNSDTITNLESIVSRVAATTTSSSAQGGSTPKQNVETGALAALRDNVQDLRDQLNEVRGKIGGISELPDLVDNLRAEVTERSLATTSQLKKDSNEIEALHSAVRQIQNEMKRNKTDLEQSKLQLMQLPSSEAMDRMQTDIRNLNEWRSSGNFGHSDTSSSSSSTTTNNISNIATLRDLERTVAEVGGNLSSITRRVNDLEGWRRSASDDNERLREHVNDSISDFREEIRKGSRSDAGISSNSKLSTNSDDESGIHVSPVTSSKRGSGTETAMAIAELRAEVDDLFAQVRKGSESEESAARRTREAVKRIEREMAELKNRIDDLMEASHSLMNESSGMVSSQKLERMNREMEEVKRKVEEMQRLGSGGDDEQPPGLIVRDLSNRIETALSNMAKASTRGETQIRVLEEEISDIRLQLRTSVDEELRKKLVDIDARTRRSNDALKQSLESEISQIRSTAAESSLELASVAALTRRLETKMGDALNRVNSELHAVEERVDNSLRDVEDVARSAKGLKEVVQQLQVADAAHVAEIDALTEDIRRIDTEMNHVRQQVLDAVVESASKSLRRLTELEEWRKRMTALASTGSAGGGGGGGNGNNGSNTNPLISDSLSDGGVLRAPTPSRIRPSSASAYSSTRPTPVITAASTPGLSSSSFADGTAATSPPTRNAWGERDRGTSTTSSSSSSTVIASRSVDAATWSRERGMDRAVERDLAELKRLFGV